MHFFRPCRRSARCSDTLCHNQGLLHLHSCARSKRSCHEFRKLKGWRGEGRQMVKKELLFRKSPTVAPLFRKSDEFREAVPPNDPEHLKPQTPPDLVPQACFVPIAYRTICRHLSLAAEPPFTSNLKSSSACESLCNKALNPRPETLRLRP